MDKHKVLWAIGLILFGMALEVKLLTIIKIASRNELVVYDRCYERYKDAMYCQVRNKIKE